MVRSASRRHRRTLPPVTTAWTQRDLEERCTEGTRRVVRAADRLVEAGPAWMREMMASGVPAWAGYSELMPWQALSVMQERAGRELLPFLRFDREAVLLDHAADGHTWARAVVTGDSEDIQETIHLVSGRCLLRSLLRWSPPRDPERHDQALTIVLNRLSYGDGAMLSRLHAEVVRAIADFIRRHPEHPAPNLLWLQQHEASWREALDRAGAVRRLEEWIERERKDLARIEAEDPRVPRDLAATSSRLSPVIAASVARLLRLGEVLHRHGVPSPLRGFLERAEQPALPDRTCVAWELAVGAADALVRRGDAETLRSLREPYGSARYHAIQSVLSRKDHDEETVLWIADQLEHHYDEVLESIVGRPERRELARRWARDTSRARSFRRHAAARWLLTHPAGGSSRCRRSCARSASRRSRRSRCSTWGRPRGSRRCSIDHCRAASTGVEA